MKSNIRISLAATALTFLALTGCASPSQIEEQNKQLRITNSMLMQIQVNQAMALDLQQKQAALQIESNNLQSSTFQLHSRP